MSMTSQLFYECGTKCNVSTLSSVLDNLSSLDFNHRKRLSDSDASILSLTINCISGIIVCVCGITGNIVNLIVFAKQGFEDSINVSFASLAISDLLALLALLWRNILYIPGMESSSLPIDPMPFTYLTGGWPHVYFVRVGSWITAFITFERCLCIAMPLKVKTLVTPRRVVFIHLAIYILIAVAIAPIYYSNIFIWKFFPDKNRTLITVAYRHDRHDIERVVMPINGNVIPMGALIINIACTAILVVKLNYQKRWRQNQAAGNPHKPQNMSVKETRIITMAITISTIYIFLFGPVSVTVSWMAVDPEFRLDGQLKNTFIVVSSFAFFFQALNSSVNIFVYYNMSSKYRLTFLEMFKISRRQENLQT